jgi:hypothetical protein
MVMVVVVMVLVVEVMVLVLDVINCDACGF